jgi:tetratricopeptide (TPR) repeat protein
VLGLALPRHPGFQEWLCHGRSLPELEALERRLPPSPVVLYHLGKALQRAGRSAEAVPVLRRAAGFGGDNARAVDALAQAQIAAGQTRETFGLLRAFLERHPDSPDAYRMLGRFLLGVQTYSRAVIVLEEATRRFPQDGENWKLLASARHQFRDIRGARDAVTRATTLMPADSDVWLLQARIFRDLEMPEARAAYEQAVRLSPGDVDLRAEFADYLARMGSSPQDYTYATDLARRVLRQSPGNARAAAALGLVQAARGESDEAIPLLRQAVGQDPRDVRLLRTLSRVYRQKGDTAEAARWSEEMRRAHAYRDEEQRLLDALEVRPQDKTLLRKMARLTGTHGDALRSVRYHAIALDQPPDAAAPLLAAARDLHAGGFTGAARQFAERSLQRTRTPEERDAARTFLSALP